MRNLLLFLCIVVFMFLGMYGCVGPWPMRQLVTNASTTPNSVVVMDRNMKSCQLFTVIFGADVTVERDTGTKTDDGRLLVQVEFKNNMDRDLHLQIQTTFRDRQGLLLSDESNWEYVIIPRQSTYLYSCASMRKDAETYQVRVRRSGS